jgi:membrane protease YdiL (CAAX protease family)
MKQHREPFVKLAWGLIIVFVLGLAIIQAIPAPHQEGEADDPTGLVMAQLQGEYMLGVAALLGSEREIAMQAGILDAGTVEQRQRYMAFMIALGEPDLAKQSALKMQVELEGQQRQLSEKQTLVQEDLELLASGATLPDDHVNLKKQLGWFGELLEANSSERESLEKTAANKVLAVGGIVLFMAFAAVIGFVGLVILFVKSLSGTVCSGLNSEKPQHGIYAEVFALWLITFLVFMSLAPLLGNVMAKHNTIVAMSCSLAAFFGSLVVLFWARIRGISWKQILEDIGWTKGTSVIKESLWGIAGYAMMLPILGVGIILVLFLVFIQSIITGGASGDPFSGTSGGAHPIVLDIANGSWQIRILLVLLAAVAAPIVEETMFRGVLYRQLRTYSKKLGIALSIICSVLLSSFLFAAIHPQGWIAIPALMAIAIGMNLMREWRGTLIPSMIVHGVSNGLVTTMMIIFLS